MLIEFWLALNLCCYHHVWSLSLSNGPAWTEKEKLSSVLPRAVFTPCLHKTRFRQLGVICFIQFSSDVTLLYP